MEMRMADVKAVFEKMKYLRWINLLDKFVYDCLMADDCLEYLDKYRWHDLKTSPDDLPEADIFEGEFIAKEWERKLGDIDRKMYTSVPVIVKYMDEEKCEYMCTSFGVSVDENGKQNCEGFVNCSNNVIAWRYLELFDPDEED